VAPLYQSAASPGGRWSPFGLLIPRYRDIPAAGTRDDTRRSVWTRSRLPRCVVIGRRTAWT